MEYEDYTSDAQVSNSSRVKVESCATLRTIRNNIAIEFSRKTCICTCLIDP